MRPKRARRVRETGVNEGVEESVVIALFEGRLVSQFTERM